MRKYSIIEVKELAAKCNGRLDAVYLHWTAGRYGQFFEDYHICIDADGSIYMPDGNFMITRRHTWHRNSEAVGIAICACYGAIANEGRDADFGDYPPTAKQIETLAILVAIFRKYAGVSLDRVFTHCEIAFVDGYGPYQDSDCRWDLWYLPDYDGKMRPGGEVIRGKARWYMLNTNLI